VCSCPAAPTPTRSPPSPTGSARGRLSLLAVPGLPPPGQLLRLGVARLSHGPAPHRHALAALTDLAAGLQATTTIDN